jgi:hypothetical protein
MEESEKARMGRRHSKRADKKQPFCKNLETISGEQTQP